MERPLLVLPAKGIGRFRYYSVGDAGPDTALEASDLSDGNKSTFVLYSDGGYKDLIIEGGGFRDRFPEDPRK